MLIIKIGGSVITDKAGFEKINPRGLTSFASTLARFCAAHPQQPIVLVHGAGSFGHPHVAKHGLSTPPASRAPDAKRAAGVVATQAAVAKLNTALVGMLNAAGVPAKGVLTRHCALTSEGRLQSLDLSSIQLAWKSGAIPVLPGDIVPDLQWGQAVLSGDQIVSYLGKDAERIVVLTSTEGILKEGKSVERIDRGNLDSVIGHVTGADVLDVTGGMRGKLMEMLSIGKPVAILSASDESNVLAALEGKPFRGTLLG
ncbi:MAG: hypothetical protein KGH63_00995 [Candidatus Micrarchaeota archaeon]|nr:hypothetical protein [Candidatus Micrarchaeota archaeon]